MEASLAVSLQRASAVAVSCLSVIYVHNYTICDLFKEFHSSRKGLFCRYQLSIVSILLTVESCYLENHAFLVPEPAEKPPLQFHWFLCLVPYHTCPNWANTGTHYSSERVELSRIVTYMADFCTPHGSTHYSSEQCHIPLVESSFADVHPLINHSSSSATPRQNTRFVVSKGNWLRRLNLIWAPNTDLVPTPVRSPFSFPCAKMWRIRSRYWCSSWRQGRSGVGTLAKGGGAYKQVHTHTTHAHAHTTRAHARTHRTHARTHTHRTHTPPSTSCTGVCLAITMLQYYICPGIVLTVILVLGLGLGLGIILYFVIGTWSNGPHTHTPHARTHTLHARTARTICSPQMCCRSR